MTHTFSQNCGFDLSATDSFEVLEFEQLGNKIVLLFWSIIVVYFILIYTKYINVSSYLSISMIYICTIFPMTSMFIWLKFKKKLLLIKNNKELIHTIRTILQNFPEGVVIRSADPVSK